MFEMGEIVATDDDDVARVTDKKNGMYRLFNGVNSYWIDKKKIKRFMYEGD